MIGIALCLLSLAHASDTDLSVNGYVAPLFKQTQRTRARPVDQNQIGMDSSTAGLVFSGQATPHWHFKAHLVIGADAFPALTGAEPVDTDNNGTIDTISTTTEPAINNIIEEASITYAPWHAFGLRVGRMRIPFTSQSQSANTALMFPDRAGPNEVFLEGTDLGGLAEVNVFDGRIRGSGGLFNGTGLSAGSIQRLGALYTGRIDIQPLGDFGFDETSTWGAPFRIGAGAGIVYNPYTAYDSAGYPTVTVRDVRGSVSGRIGFYGVLLSGEWLRRHQVDSMSSRPEFATGIYGQIGWRLPYGFEPAFRMGQATEDESFDPRTTRWIEGGLNSYPALNADNPDKIKLSALYLDENRVTEGERANGVAIRAQVQW